MTGISDPKQWAHRYADFLYSYALVRLDDGELARDLVQETFLAALEQLDRFQGQSSERTWLAAILKYKVIAVYRRRNSAWQEARNEPEPRAEFFEADTGHWKESFAPGEMGAEVEDPSSREDPSAREELIAILRKCLQKLPALWASIFSMKHMDEVASEVICQELKITPSNFWVIIHRAKLNLRACIQKERS